MSVNSEPKKYKITVADCGDRFLLEVDGCGWCFGFSLVGDALMAILRECNDNHLIERTFYSESHMLAVMRDAGYNIEIEGGW